MGVHNRKLNHRIKKIHEYALRIVYNYHQCTFEELFETDNSFTIHERNVHKLVIEMFKGNNRLCAFHFVEIFQFVEIQSALFCIFRTDWNFLIEFCSSEPNFNRNILRPLYLKFKTSAHAEIAITH